MDNDYITLTDNYEMSMKYKDGMYYINDKEIYHNISKDELDRSVALLKKIYNTYTDKDTTVEIHSYYSDDYQEANTYIITPEPSSNIFGIAGSLIFQAFARMKDKTDETDEELITDLLTTLAFFIGMFSRKGYKLDKYQKKE